MSELDKKVDGQETEGAKALDLDKVIAEKNGKMSLWKKIGAGLTLVATFIGGIFVGKALKGDDDSDDKEETTEG